MVRIDEPPPQRPLKPIIKTLVAGAELLRIYRPLSHGNRACSFRRTGPLHRFDHHEPAGDGTDQQAGSRGILYCGFSLSCCLVECFGDTGLIETEGRQLALLETTRPIKLLDLQGNGAMRAGTVVAISGAADRQLSQKWSRYFYDCYQDIDGLIYSNAHNAEAAVALYELAEDSLRCCHDFALNNSELRSRILQVALDHGLVT